MKVSEDPTLNVVQWSGKGWRGKEQRLDSNTQGAEQWGI